MTLPPDVRNRILYRKVLGPDLNGVRSYSERLLFFLRRKQNAEMRLVPKFESTLVSRKLTDQNAVSCIENPDDTTCIGLSSTNDSVTISDSTEDMGYKLNYTTIMSTIYTCFLDRNVSGTPSDFASSQYYQNCNVKCGRMYDTMIMVGHSDLEIHESTMGEIVAIDDRAVPRQYTYNDETVFRQSGTNYILEFQIFDIPLVFLSPPYCPVRFFLL